MNLLGHLRHRDEEGNQVSDYIAYTVKAVDRGLELCEKAETLHGTRSQKVSDERKRIAKPILSGLFPWNFAQ